MVQALCKLAGAEVVVSSEIHFRKIKTTGAMKVFDLGWGSDPEGKAEDPDREREDEKPENFWLAAPSADASFPAGRGLGQLHRRAGEDDELIPVRPTEKRARRRYLIVSQYALPHAGVVDQLGLHRSLGRAAVHHRRPQAGPAVPRRAGPALEARRDPPAKDPATDLPPRLSQTLDELLAGSSEKQIAMKLELSRHTIHNYVKALHQRFGVVQPRRAARPGRQGAGELHAEAEHGAAAGEGPRQGRRAAGVRAWLTSWHGRPAHASRQNCTAELHGRGAGATVENHANTKPGAVSHRPPRVRQHICLTSHFTDWPRQLRLGRAGVVEAAEELAALRVT